MDNSNLSCLDKELRSPDEKQICASIISSASGLSDALEKTFEKLRPDIFITSYPLLCQQKWPEGGDAKRAVSDSAELPPSKRQSLDDQAEDDSEHDPSDAMGRDEPNDQPQTAPDKVFTISGKSYNIDEFLASDGFQQHIASLDDETAPPVINNALKATLKPWQGTGATKLMRLGNSLLGGGILGDRVDMGKTLTSLLAALELRRKLTNPGFILIVCRSGAVLQWNDEIQRHFHVGKRPSCIILNSPRCLATTLLPYEIVICSHSYLRTRFLERREWLEYHQILFAGGPGLAEKYFKKKKNEMPFLSSPLFTRAQKGISVLLVDEAHDARGPHTVLNEALRALPYKYALLVTGTPISNTFADFYGLLTLLPGCPFESFEHFKKVMSTEESDEEDTPVHLRKEKARSIFHKISRASTLTRSGVGYQGGTWAGAVNS